MSLTIEKIIDFFQKNATQSNPHLLLSPYFPKPKSLYCKWNEPVSMEVIDSFFDEHDWVVPQDYKQFLSYHNGGTLFCSPDYGGGIYLLSLEEIKVISSEYPQIPADCCPIAWTDSLIGAIGIDSSRLAKGNEPYLFFLDVMYDMTDAKYMNLTFTEWLERLILCQGEEYWNW